MTHYFMYAISTLFGATLLWHYKLDWPQSLGDFHKLSDGYNLLCSQRDVRLLLLLLSVTSVKKISRVNKQISAGLKVKKFQFFILLFSLQPISYHLLKCLNESHCFFSLESIPQNKCYKPSYSLFGKENSIFDRTIASKKILQKYDKKWASVF